MSPKLLDLLSKAENDLLQKNYREALSGLGALIQKAPDEIRSRFLVAQALEGLKEKSRAFDVYSSLCLHCLRAGHPLVGLAALKQAAGILANIDDLVALVVELYSLDSDKTSAELTPPPLPELPPEAEAPPPLPLDGRLPTMVAQLAKSFPGARYPRRLPQFPLISLLHAEAILPIIEVMQVRRCLPGEFVVREGEPCSAVFLLAIGEVEIVQGESAARSLARLGAGSIFGEMALISDGPRMASARAIRQSELLVLPVVELQATMEDLDDVTWAVARFTRQRFLANLMATCPVFTPFPPEQRKEVMDKFTSIGIPTDEIVIREGNPGEGLYLILGGEVEVTKADAGSQVHLATMHEGSVFGEISLLFDTPATATVRAVRGGEFLFLPRQDFQDLIAQNSQIEHALRELSRERLAEQRSALDRAQSLSESGVVMI